MNLEEYNDLVEKFKEVDVKKLPVPLMLQLTVSQSYTTKYAKELEKHANKTIELMKQAIVLDGINKSKK